MKTHPAALCAVLFASLLTAWIPARWPVSILEIGSFGLASFCLLRPERVKLSPLLWPLGAAVLCGLLQLALHGTLGASQTGRATLAWAAHLALAFAALQMRRTDLFLRAALAFGVGLSVLATLQTFTSPGKVFWLFAVSNPVFLMGPFLYHSHYAAFVELLLPLALVPAIRDPARRVPYSLAAGVLTASVIASASRGGFFIVLLEIACIVGLCRGRESGAALAAILAATGVLTAVVGWDALEGRFAEKSYRDAGRWEMLQSSLAMIRDHPWKGVGLGNWAAAYPAYARYDDGLIAFQAHSDWAQWTAEGGVGLTAAMLFLLGWSARQGLRTPWCLGPVFVFAHATFDYQFQKPQIAALTFTFLAVAAAATVQRQKA